MLWPESSRRSANRRSATSARLNACPEAPAGNVLSLEDVLGPAEARPQGARALVYAPCRRRMLHTLTQSTDAAPCRHHCAAAGGAGEPEPEVERLEIIGELELEGVASAQKLDAPQALARGCG